MNRPAFTLVELLITIAIMGVLVGMASVSYAGIRERSRDAQRQNDLAEIKLSLTTYFDAQVPRSYPSATTAVTIDNSTDALTAALKPSYIREVPVDPINSGDYVYNYQSIGTTDYVLSASLENKNSKKGWGGGSAWVAGGYQVRPD